MAAAAMVKSEAIESVLVQGDLARLNPDERILYYRKVCDSLGLNPLTKPFEYLELDKKLVLYATRSCTDQLRKLHTVSIAITDRKPGNSVYIVTAKATTPDGRSDESTGAVPLEREQGEWKTNSNGKRYFQGNGKFEPLKGDALANALMKAETKAKRRVTLSICGLGMLDESEIESIPNARPVQTDVQQLPPPPPPVQKPPKSTPKVESNPLADALRAELTRTGKSWEMCMFWVNSQYPGQVVFGKETKYGELTEDMVQRLVKNLKTMPAVTKHEGSQRTNGG